MMKLIVPTLSLLTSSRTSFAFVSILTPRHAHHYFFRPSSSSAKSLSPDAFFDDPSSRGSSMMGDQTEPAWTTDPGYSYSDGGGMRRNYAGDGPLAPRRGPEHQDFASRRDSSNRMPPPDDYDYDDNNNYIYADPQQTSIQGGSRRTWQGAGQMSTTTLGQDSGRPMFAEYEIWDGPNNTPQSVNLYSEDGSMRPARINNRAGGGGTMQIRNTGPMTYPMTAGVSWQHPPRQQYYEETYAAPMSSYGGTTVQGGALKTFQFDDASIRNVHIILTTMGTPLKALIELWQGPNNVKQIAEVYSDDGLNKPFEMVFDTPGYGTTIAVRNVGPVEYPLKAIAEPVGYADY